MMGSKRSGKRGVSNTVAFVLTFSIIISSVTLVSTFGAASLGDVREGEQINAAERGMQGLDATFDDLYRRNAPVRTTGLALHGGALQTNDSEISVTVHTASGTTSETVEINSLDHVLNGNTMSYENGAVFRSDGGSARRAPAMQCLDDGTAIVSLVNLTTEEDIHVSSQETVEVTGRRTNTELLYANSGDPDKVVVDVSDTANREHWNRYLNRTKYWTVDLDSHTCTADRIFVRETTIEISAET